MNIGPVEKNNLYHNILQSIRNKNPEAAAADAIMLFEDYLTNKEYDEVETESGEVVIDAKSKMTGCFKRSE
jgi:hypothetical protein